MDFEMELNEFSSSVYRNIYSDARQLVSLTNQRRNNGSYSIHHIIYPLHMKEVFC